MSELPVQVRVASIDDIGDGTPFTVRITDDDEKVGKFLTFCLQATLDHLSNNDDHSQMMYDDMKTLERAIEIVEEWHFQRKVGRR